MIAAVRHVSLHFKSYACLAYLISALERIFEAVQQVAPYYQVRFNLLTQYFVNYVDHGFAKRALPGTLLRPVLARVENPEAVVFWLMVAINLAALAMILVLAERYLAHRTGPGGDSVATLRCALAVGSLGVMQVAHDLGRYDMLAFAVLIGAVTLIARDRVTFAAALSVTGLLIHEAFAVYGAPLVIAVGWQTLRKRLSPSQTAIRLAPLVAAIAAASITVLLYGNSDSAVHVTHGGGGYVWARGLIEVFEDLTVRDALVFAAYWSALAVMLVGAYRGAGRKPDAMLVAAFCPLALNLLGTDHARWLTLGFYLVLVTFAIQARSFDLAPPNLRPWQRRFACLLCLPMGPMGVVDAFAWLS